MFKIIENLNNPQQISHYYNTAARKRKPLAEVRIIIKVP